MTTWCYWCSWSSFTTKYFWKCWSSEFLCHTTQIP